MKFESIKAGVLMSLRHAFNTVQVEPIEIPIENTNPMFRDQWINDELGAVVFYLNGCERWIMFYANTQYGLCFARPKVGIMEELVYQIRPGDCRFNMDDDIDDKFHVMSRFLDGVINNRVQKELEDQIGAVVNKATEEYDYTISFHLVAGNRRDLSYRANFQLHYKLKDEDEYKLVEGSIKNTKGDIHMLMNFKWNGASTCLEDIFY